MKVAPPFIKHCLHCLHCFDCLHCLHYLHSGIYINVGLLTWWHCWHCYIAACRIGFGAESGTGWVDYSALQWSGWKAIMLWISISSMVFDIVGPLEARTSKFRGVSGARRRLPPAAQPVKTTSGHCRVLRFYFVFLLQKSEEVIFFTDPVPPSTNQYRPKLTQYHTSYLSFFYTSKIFGE